ncbi:MAG: SAM-dependent chlorinase/fluorinase [Pyrinomonadaceae bacterium]|nr:SAM-dependent chlorinase/fluorinase [Pyrinomonadaceae bacterium]
MLIALLTDFGTSDYFVGAMKGVIKTINPDCEIVDITHDIPPQDVIAASFILRSACAFFPERSILTAVVDPGVGTQRKCILVEFNDRFFIAPDNGLLSFIFNSGDPYSVREITNASYFLQPISNTFHGRDIFAPAAAHLSKGYRPDTFGDFVEQYVKIPDAKPDVRPDGSVIGEIIYIDRFGNLITNLTADLFSGNHELIVGNKRIDRLSKNFAEGLVGEPLIYNGSAGFIEIGVKNGNASEILKITRGMQIRLQKQL